MLGSSQSYSDLLRAEFEKKRIKNPTYSLRAFARDLKISSSTASLLMRGKVGLSRKKAMQISKRLGFTQEEALYFTDLVRAKCAKREKARQESLFKLRQYDTRFNSIEIEAFHLISKWYIIPIMELIRIHGEIANEAFLARKLRLSGKEVQKACEALRSLRILRTGDRGNEIASDFLSLPDGPPDALVRQTHRDLLDQAKKAVSSQSVSERNIGCTIVRMRKKDVDWAAKELRDFCRKLSARIEQGDGHDAVYAISTQLFRLDCDE